MMIKSVMKKWGLSVVSMMVSGAIILTLLLSFNINIKNTVEESVHINMTEMNHTASISLNNSFTSFVDLLEHEVKVFAMMENPTDMDLMAELIDFAKKDQFKNTAILTYAGDVYSSYRGMSKARDGDATPNLHAEGTVISQPRIFWDDSLVIDISTPIYIDGEPMGKLVATVDSKTIATMVNNKIVQGKAALCLIAGDGTVITRVSERESPLAAGTNLFSFYGGAGIDFITGSPQAMGEDFKTGGTNWLKYNYFGESVCVFYEPLGFNDWYLMIAVTDDALLTQIHQLKTSALLMTLGILVVVICTSIIIITQRMKEQRRLIALKNTYSIAISKTNDLFYETDIDNDLFIDHSENVDKKIWKETPKNYSNALNQVADICSPEYKQGFLDNFLPQNIKIKIKEGISSINFEYKITPDKDTVRWLSATFVPVFDETTNSTKLICMENDITDQMLRQENLKRLAIIDDLTGLYNKATTLQYINAFLANEGSGGKHAFLIIDIDHFKSVNDNLGHSKGDEVLSEFGRGLKRIFRRNDIVGRIGGDEFIVMLKDYGSMELITGKADEVRDIVRKEYPIATEGGISVKTTASIGIALYPQDGNSFEDLYKNGDIALYVSKKDGRDRHTFIDVEMKNE